MSTPLEFSVRSYGLAMFLIGSGFRPLRSELGRDGSVSYSFVHEAKALMSEFTFARNQMEMLVSQMERGERREKADASRE